MPTANPRRELARLALPVALSTFLALANAVEEPGATVRAYNGSLIFEAAPDRLPLEDGA